MGSLVRGLLRKSPPFRVISSLSSRNSNPSLQSIFPLLAPPQPNSSAPDQSNSNPSPTADSSPQFKLQSPIFPSFPFGLFLDPIHPSGLLDLVPDVERTEDTATIWADSVKKKRKKKMNKHKYKKLRKRLRRKT